MKKSNFTIQKYSGIAGVFLLIPAENQAQAVYTDVEPDIEIQFDGQTAGIDMDNNGTFDFAFLKTSGSFTYATTSFTFLLFGHRIWAGPEVIENEIAGEMVTHGAGYGTTYFPYALNSGAAINEDLSFQNWGFQVMGSGFYESDGDWNDQLGKWNPDIDSAFLGVRFYSNDACIHYGWIRCTTADSTKRLIIHDYAFESKCETPIIAGDTIGDTTTLETGEFNSLLANVYSFNKTIYINTNVNSPLKLEVVNLNGESLIIHQMNQNHAEINMDDYPTGIYFVKLEIGDRKIVKKFFIN